MPPQKTMFKAFEMAFQFGIILVASLLVTIGAGLYLDHTLHTKPLFLIIGLFLPIPFAGMYLYRAAKNSDEGKNDLPK